MQLKQIWINREEWGEGAGRLKGNVTFTSPLGEVKVNLNPVHTERIIQVVAEAMVQSTKEVAALMTNHVIEQATTKAIGHDA